VPSTDTAGLTYRLVLALYLATGAAATVVAALVADEATAGLVAVGAVGTWLGGTVLAAAALGWVGVPRWLHPRPLYAAGRSWLPALGGLVLASTGVGVVVSGRGAGAAATLLLGGAAVATLGWVVRAMARNAEARARLDGSEVVAWQARPAKRRRVAWYTAGGLFVAVVLGVMLWTRDWSFLGSLGVGIALAAQGANRTQYWLGDRTLVYGNPQVRYLLVAGDVTGVRHTDAAISIERRGWRPPRTLDPADLSDPRAVVAALDRLAATTDTGG
jgi:hypothetical protein